MHSGNDMEPNAMLWYGSCTINSGRSTLQARSSGSGLIDFKVSQYDFIMSRVSEVLSVSYGCKETPENQSLSLVP